MRFSDIRDLNLPPGQLSIFTATEATLAHAATQRVDPRGPSHNQHGHIAHALTRRVDPDLVDLVVGPNGETSKAPPTGWLGVSFEVPTIDAHLLGPAFEAWVDRHETLRSGFRPTSVAAGKADIERFTLQPNTVHFDEIDLGSYGDPALVADTLDDLFNRATDAISWPAYAFVAIGTPKTTTVVMAFDHVNIDGYSILLAVTEIRELVASFAEGRPAELSPVPSYVDFVQRERTLAASASTEHEAVEVWREFLGATSTLPSFPLDDGLPPGSQVPQQARCIPILTEAQGTLFGAWCRAHGVSSAAGFLAAMSLAFTRLGRAGGHQEPSATCSGPDTVRFRSLVSTHTRHEPQWAEALGWFTAIAPFGVDLATDDELVDILASVGDAWRCAKQGAGLAMSRIGELLETPLQPRFVVSYLDARHARSAQQWSEWNAHAYLGDVGPTDEVYLWINRVPDETYLTWRYPGNAVCAAQIEAVTESMRRIILDAVSIETEPVRSEMEAVAQW